MLIQRLKKYWIEMVAYWITSIYVVSRLERIREHRSYLISFADRWLNVKFLRDSFFDNYLKHTVSI